MTEHTKYKVANHLRAAALASISHLEDYLAGRSKFTIDQIVEGWANTNKLVADIAKSMIEEDGK